MNCDRARSLLDDLLDGILSTTAGSQVEGHLKTCAACREEWEALRQTVGLLRAAPAPALPPTFWQETRMRLNSLPPPRQAAWTRRLLSARGLAYGLPAAAVAGIALFALAQTRGGFPLVGGAGSSSEPGRTAPERPVAMQAAPSTSDKEAAGAGDSQAGVLMAPGVTSSEASRGAAGEERPVQRRLYRWAATPEALESLSAWADRAGGERLEGAVPSLRLRLPADRLTELEAELTRHGGWGAEELPVEDASEALPPGEGPVDPVTPETVWVEVEILLEPAPR